MVLLEYSIFIYFFFFRIIIFSYLYKHKKKMSTDNYHNYQVPYLYNKLKREKIIF